MTYITSDLKKRNKDRVGCPDPKGVEQTGKDTFVVHTHGRDKFEGKFDPKKYAVKGGKVVQIAR